MLTTYEKAQKIKELESFIKEEKVEIEELRRRLKCPPNDFSELSPKTAYYKGLYEGKLNIIFKVEQLIKGL